MPISEKEESSSSNSSVSGDRPPNIEEEEKSALSDRKGSDTPSVHLEPIELVNKDEEVLKDMLTQFEGDEERFIRTELALQKNQDEMINNKDF